MPVETMSLERYLFSENLARNNPGFRGKHLGECGYVFGGNVNVLSDNGALDL